MPKYANQKHITINKAKCDKDNIYGQINRKAMADAAKDLKPNAFKLWCYLSINQDKYEFDLSQIAIENEFGIKKDAYDAAIKELIGKNYLVLISKKTYYNFYEIPRVKEDNSCA